MITTAPPVHPTALPAILLAIQRFDPGRIGEVLDIEAAEHGHDVVVDDIVFPTLRIVGTFWTYGSFSITHEHLFTAAATRWLHARINTQQLSPSRSAIRRPVVLAAGPDDSHVIGLDCLELLLATRGINVCNLGARVPADALVATATTVDAAAVVVCSHAGPTAGGTSSATSSLRSAHAAELAVYYAGSSFDSLFMQRRIPGTALSHSVAASADLLARLVAGPDGQAVQDRQATG